MTGNLAKTSGVTTNATGTDLVSEKEEANDVSHEGHDQVLAHHPQARSQGAPQVSQH